MTSGRNFSGGVILLLVGICLAGFAWFAPDNTGRPGAFFKTAIFAPWQPPLKFGVAWCSLKIMLGSVGLFLVIESVATLLARRGHRVAARLVYGLRLVSCAGVLLSGYGLIKALI